VRSWQNGTSSCSNRLTIRIKVAEPLILAKLQSELQRPQNVAYISKAVEREAKKALSAARDSSATRKLLDQEKRKLQNLLAALEDGSPTPSSVLKAIADREKTIAHLERDLETPAREPTEIDPGDLRLWVERQLTDLASLLREDVPRVKTEFRRLNLALTFKSVEAQPRPHYVVEGQCDLSALVFSYVRPAQWPTAQSGRRVRQGAGLVSLGEHQGS
jgi:hypothetical protein